jgi:hypothetical protein
VTRIGRFALGDATMRDAELEPEPEPEDEALVEVEVTVVPREPVLDALGIDPEAFEAAVGDAFAEREALAARDDVEDDDIPPLEEMPIVIAGATYTLGDLAEIEIHGPEA